MYITDKTTKGDSFKVFINNDGDIEYNDGGDVSWTWDNTKANRDIVYKFIETITKQHHSLWWI